MRAGGAPSLGGRAGAVAAVLAGLLALTACTGSRSATDIEDTGTSAAPSSSGSTAAPLDTRATPRPPGSDGGLTVATQARIPLPPGMRVMNLTLGAGRLAWSGCLPCAGAAQDATDVYVADLPAGRPRVVAGTRFRWGSTAVVGLTGNTLVWLDDADIRDGDTLRSRWALRALDLRSGASWTVAEGGRRGDPAQEPVAVVAGGQVTWQLYDTPTGGGPVSSADPRTHAVRLVTRRLPGLLRAATAFGLVYTASHRDPRNEGDEMVPFDAYLLPPGGGAATAVTPGNDVADAAADDGQVLWSTAHGDDASLWSRELPGGAPAVVFPRPVITFVPGRGFAAWMTREADPVVEVGTGGAPLALPDVPAQGGGLAADGDRLAFLTVPDRGVAGPLSVVVTRVTART